VSSLHQSSIINHLLHFFDEAKEASFFCILLVFIQQANIESIVGALLPCKKSTFPSSTGQIIHFINFLPVLLSHKQICLHQSSFINRTDHPFINFFQAFAIVQAKPSSIAQIVQFDQAFLSRKQCFLWVANPDVVQPASFSTIEHLDPTTQETQFYCRFIFPSNSRSSYAKLADCGMNQNHYSISLIQTVDMLLKATKG
jgi:hypothetical protein